MLPYVLWTTLSAAISLFGVIKLWPVYEGNDFPLFTDLVTIGMFMPAFFVLMFGVIGSLLTSFVTSRPFKIGAVVLLFLAAFLYSLRFLEFSSGVRIIVSVVTASIGYLHFILSVNFYKIE